jgi:dihydroorotate dehydrogenase (NAD+) catalytic subunit
MINAVGLQGPGHRTMLEDDLPELSALGARVVASIWGPVSTTTDWPPELLAGSAPGVVAVEVNLSCPNLEGRRSIFAHDPELSAEVIAATAACGLPRWAKLSPNTDRIVEVARAVRDAGADAVTLVNTLLGHGARRAHDAARARRRRAAGTPGRPLHAVAVRPCSTCTRRCPELPIVGVGGVSTAGTRPS